MNTITKMIITSIFFTVISVFLYLSFRVEVVEKNYAQYLKNSNSMIQETISKNSSQFKQNPELLKELFKKISSKYPELGLIVLSDNSGKIQNSTKNDSIIPSGELFETIIEDFSSQKISIAPEKGYTNRYYTFSNKTKKKNQVRFYLFINESKDFKSLVVFPYKPGKAYITRIILEVLLIIVAAIFITTLVYMRHQKKTMKIISPDEIDNIIEKDKKYEAGSQPNVPKAPSAEIDRKKSAKITEIKKETSQKTGIELKNKGTLKQNATFADKPDTKTDTGELDSSTFKFFKNISSVNDSEHISLFLKEDETYIKRYELHEQSFLKYSGQKTETLNIESSIGSELKMLRSLITKNNTRLIIPISFNQELLGVMVLQSSSQIKGKTIATIKQLAQKYGKQLHLFYIKNDETRDPSTGMPNKHSFLQLYSDVLKKYEDSGQEFSVLFISLVKKPLALSENSLNHIIKVIYLKICDMIPGSAKFFIYDRYLAFIFPSSSTKEARDIASELIRELNYYRIKTPENINLDLNPRAGYAGTDTAEDPALLHEKALSNLETALRS